MACLSYDHAVVYNGKFYPANTPVEVTEDVTEEKTTITDTETVANKATVTEDVTEEKTNANKKTGRKPKSTNTTE